ncbi:YHS domain-containing protein [bacterium]|nr:YHS domain-containing protein [bacterium]
MPVNQSRRSVVKYLSLSAVVIPALSAIPAYAKSTHDPIYTTKSSNDALQGYDTVAYFTAGKAVKGEEQFSTMHEGAIWLFSSDENLQTFMASPERYMPQFGGYCAFSVAQGKIVKGDAKLWEIVDNKLYVNYNKGIHKLWLKRPEQLIAEAQENWPTILG